MTRGQGHEDLEYIAKFEYAIFLISIFNVLNWFFNLYFESMEGAVPLRNNAELVLV